VGVSAITVSRALRNPAMVSLELRETILKTVEQMGYVPDLAARTLASRHSGVVGVLVPALSLQIIGPIMQGIEDRLQPTGLRLQYASTRHDVEQEAISIRAFLAQKPAGLILIGPQQFDPQKLFNGSDPCPIISVVDLGRPMKMPAIGVRHRPAAERITRFLLDKGYRRIGLIRGHASVPYTEIQNGYEQAMRDAGLFDPALMASALGYANVALGCQLFTQLLDQAPDVDAVLCHGDELALGVLFECQRRGISVPDQMGICGFYDFDFAASTHPPLTTVHVPRYDSGYRAADILVRAIENDEAMEDTVELDFTIMERGTTR
jgi:LacI family gluconate utilization system Gnt-I transcriptional repressor